MLTWRGIEGSRETVHHWVIKFGFRIAANLGCRRGAPTGRRHLDKMLVKNGGRRIWLWRAVDDEGEMLDMPVQMRRNAKMARELLPRLMKNTSVRPETVKTDGFAFYQKAMRQEGLSDRHRPGRIKTENRAENLCLSIRRREREQQRFKSQGSAQRFLASHATVYNCFNIAAHLVGRSTLRDVRAPTFEDWAKATRAA